MGTYGSRKLDERGMPEQHFFFLFHICGNSFLFFRSINSVTKLKFLNNSTKLNNYYISEIYGVFHRILTNME